MSIRKILHAADIHLDSPMQNLEAYPDAPVEEFRGATRAALNNLVDLAISQKVDLVVIAGDLYDGDWDDAHTGLFFVAQASRLRAAGIPIVVIRGNHDAALLMTQTLRLPDNPDGSSIMLDHDAVDRRVFESLGIAVHGRSFATKAVTDDLSRDYPPAIPGYFNLGLLHTCLTGSEGHQSYAPTSPDKLSIKGYDYWALGHIHDRRQCHLADQTPMVFSGNTQGRHIRETGAKGCMILSIDPANKIASSFHPLDVTRWAVMHYDATDASDTNDLYEAFTVWLATQLDEAGHRPIAVRVRISGKASLHDAFHRDVFGLENQLRSIALQQGGGRVWIEQLRLRTERASTNTNSKIVITDTAEGPYASLHHVLQQFRTDQVARDSIPLLLKPLWNKLPDQLMRNDSQPLRMDTPDAISQWIDQVEPELITRLQALEDAS
jgi:DNA repair exonuclease SbcCD nuclease subunit